MKDKDKDKEWGADADSKRKEKVKHSIEKAIMRNLPADGVKQITQPLSITMMRAELSPMQVNMIVEMMEKFKDIIEAQLSKTLEERLKSPSLFSDEDMEQERYIARFPLSDLGVRKDAYKELEEAAAALQRMQIRMPVVRPDNTTSIDFFSLFSRISIPAAQGNYAYKGGKRRVGYIEMTMDRQAFNDVMRIGPQYTKYIKQVTRTCKCSYTSRMYMFISTYKAFGKWVVPYTDFHQMLGFSREERGKVEVMKYEMYSDVKKRVLEPAMKELKAMADVGEADCYYTYEAQMPAGKKRGTPEKLVFTIYSSALGKELAMENRKTADFIEIEKFLRQQLDQTQSNVRKLMELVTEENRAGFMEKMKQLKAYTDKAEHRPENLRSYAWKSLYEYLKDRQVGAEVVDEMVRGTDDKRQAPGDNDTGSTASIPDKKPTLPPLSEEVKEKWQVFMEGVKRSVEVKITDYTSLFGNLKPLAYDPEKCLLTIGVPTRTFAEILMQKYQAVIDRELRAVFGEGVQVTYTARP